MIKKLPCIGMVGYMQSGKNTVAEILSGLGYSVEERSFAYELRQKACGIFDLDFETTTTEEGKASVVKRYIPTHSELLCYDMTEHTANRFFATFKRFINKDNMYEITIREILQLLGTEIYRLQDPNYWVNQVDIENGVVITDTRFPNEAKHIKDNGGILIRVTNLSQKNNNVSHASEQFISEIECDFEIINNGKYLDQLTYEVLIVVEKLRNKLCD